MNLLSRISPFFLALLLIGCAQTPVQPATPAFAPANGGFSVQMPGRAAEQPGTHNGHMYGCISNGLAYVAGYSNMPSGLDANPATANRMLDAARDGMLKNSQATLLGEEQTTLDGHPAREVRLRTPRGFLLRIKMALIGSRMYQVGVGTPMQSANTPEIAAYIDSFRFTGK